MPRPAALLALLAALAAPPAAALTCAPPDPLRSFHEADAAPEAYMVLHGRLALPASGWPDVSAGPPGYPEAPVATLPPVAARFEGFALGGNGFTHPFSGPILLDPLCAGPWCGSIGDGTWLLFARQDGADWRVAVSPCGGWAFENPPPRMLDALAACMKGGACGG
jgi:hypothetical protein